jgi:hypothetical protein
MNLRFENPRLKELCCGQAALQKTAGRPEAEAIAQLLNELVCADDLDLLDRLPHIDIKSEEDDQMTITGIGRAGVRLSVDSPQDTSALVLSVWCGDRPLEATV